MNDWENQWVDYYAVLEINRNANMEQIKKKYHKLIKKYHPDVYAGEDGIEKIQLINKAYDILSDPEKKEMYDLEYDRRLNSEPSNNDSGSTEDNMDAYTEEEQQYAKKVAMKAIIEQELEKVNIVIDTKNTIIYSAYDETIDKYAYYKNVKEFVTMANEYIKELYDLCELCDKYELFPEIEMINEVILYLEGHVKDIPLSPSSAIRFMKEESKKENLIAMGTKINSEIEETIHNIETLFYCVYQKQVSHIEFNQFSESVLVEAKDVISSSREFVLLLSKNDLEIPELENALGKLGALIQTWPEDYEAACQIGKCNILKNNMDDVLRHYKEYVKKIEKIVKIIKRYPVNHRVEVLYNYSKELSQEITKILEHALDNNLDEYTKKILEKTYSLSSEGQEIYNSANEISKEADEIYNTREIHEYDNKTIEILLKQAVNQFDKGKSLELLKQAGYYLHIFDEINTLQGYWPQMTKILNSNINEVQRYNVMLDEMMKTIKDITQEFYASQLQKKENKPNVILKRLVLLGIIASAFIEFFGVEVIPPLIMMESPFAIFDILLLIKNHKTANNIDKMYKEKCYKRYLDLKEGKIL